MNSVMFFLRFTIPAMISLILVALWIGYLVFWPTIAADLMYGSNEAFSDVMQCSEWERADGHQMRNCTLDTGLHVLVFSQRFSKEIDGNTILIPQNIQSEIKVGSSALWTVILLVSTLLVWRLWQKGLDLAFNPWMAKGKSIEPTNVRIDPI